MKVQRELRVGDIDWLEDCEPLRGDSLKTRPVVVLTSTESELAIGGVFVVACTSGALSVDIHAIELPIHPQGRVRSGLRKKYIGGAGMVLIDQTQ